jgi:hypothetical protein
MSCPLSNGILQTVNLYPRVFAELNDRGVRYVVVGGLAVVLHGHARLTMDADIVVALDEENARRTVDALLALGFVPRSPISAHSFASELERAKWIEEKNMLVFSMSDPATPFFAIDLFVDPPIPYAELATHAETRELDGVPISVCSRNDLIRMKRISGRPEDLADIEALEAISH